MLNLTEIIRSLTVEAPPVAPELRPGAAIRPLDVTTETVRRIGDLLQYGLPWSALIVLSLLETSQLESWRWFYIGTANALLTSLFKYLFNFTSLGTRPDGGPDSMPSGHTSSAFMGAAFFHFQFGLLWAILPYLLAALTAYSRVAAKRHWPRDVVAGAILAIVINYVLFFIVDVTVPVRAHP